MALISRLMTENLLDQALEMRPGEEIDPSILQDYLTVVLGNGARLVGIKQFPSGYSNLTYLIQLSDCELVLRRPPLGAKIKTAHDVAREFNVLKKLRLLYDKIPKVIALCEDPIILGAPFYLMERLEGVILRQSLPGKLLEYPSLLHKVSTAVVDNLATLHQLPWQGTLSDLGKPKGYVKRQIEGWISRYRACQNTEIKGMNLAMEWMADFTCTPQAALVHNDYKYDNIMLDAGSWELIAVLDWEMATIGHPLMDLGTSLGYWAEPRDHPALKPFGLTWHHGNLNRHEVVERYFSVLGSPPQDVLPFYVFGCFKIGVIVQQIYHRYLKGLTLDPRFASLGSVVEACAGNIENAIKYKRINNFY